MAKPQICVSASAEPSLIWRVRGSTGTQKHPQEWAGGTGPGRAYWSSDRPRATWARRLVAGTDMALAELFFAGATEAEGTFPLSPALCLCRKEEQRRANTEGNWGMSEVSRW